MEKDTIRAALDNREYLYRYLWRIFASEPDEAMMALIASDETRDEVQLVFGAGTDGYALQEELAARARSAEADAEELDVLRSVYTRLFVGVKAPPAMPWESSYAGTEGLLFQESTLAVRQAYRDAGFVATAYRREPDDFIATELDFMAELIAECRQMLEEDSAGFRASLKAQENFLLQHLCAWVPCYAEKLSSEEGEGSNGFFVLAAQLAAEFCRADRTIVGELLKG